MAAEGGEAHQAETQGRLEFRLKRRSESATIPSWWGAIPWPATSGLPARDESLRRRPQSIAGIRLLSCRVSAIARHPALRTRVSRMHRLCFSLAALLFLAPFAAADQTAVLIDSARPGSYLITVGGNGEVTVSAVRVVTPRSSPWQPPADPETPTADPFELEVAKLTQTTLEAGGTQTTGAALSAVYSLVSDGVSNGSIPVDRAFEAVKQGSDTVAAVQPDGEKWGDFRASVGRALTTLQSHGLLGTKEQVAAVLKDIARGMNRATGFQGNPSGLIRADPRQAAARGDRAGIDIAKVIELVRIVLAILSALK
jgi:hypothetical protein